MALFIVSLVTVSGLTVMTSSLDASTRLRDIDQRLGSLQLTQAIMRRDLLQMVDRSARDEYGLEQDFVFYGGDDPRRPVLAFTRTGWENPDAVAVRSDLQYVEYWHTDGRLIRRSPVRAGFTEDTPVVSRVVLEGVSALHLEFGDGERWTEEWVWGAGGGRGGEGGPPPIIALTMDVDGLGEIRLLLMTQGEAL